jgi:hypothetical protein
MTKLAKINQFNRSGAVYYKVLQGEDGASAVTLSIDFERVPEPEHSYVADYFEVHRTEADVLVIFGKTDFPAVTELRNKIEIYFPIHPFMHQLWKSSRKLRATLEESFQRRGKTAKSQGSLLSPGVKVQTLAANNALIVNSAGQCVMDFFLIAAKDIWLKTKKGDPLNVSAIVRVFMSEHILLGLLTRCNEIAEELKDELEIPVVEDDDETLESLQL